MDADQKLRDAVQDMFLVTDKEPIAENKEKTSTEDKSIENVFESIPEAISDTDLVESRKKVDKLVADKNIEMMLNHLL